MIELTPVFNPYIILLSFGIAFIGSYMTICLCEHFRLCSFSDTKSKILNKGGLLSMMAMSLGGVAIWGMHFVGMASMSLNGEGGVNIPIKFQVMPTIISLIFVLLFAYFGLYVSSNDIVFSKNKTEIVDLFVKNASELSSRDIKAIPMWHMICIISTQSFQHLLSGGLLAGSGVCCMHYLGMWAMSFDGHIVWDEGIIAASILIALVASTAAFWILFRLLSLYPHMEFLRIASSLVMALAVCGMHYTGMAAARFYYDPVPQNNAHLHVWGAIDTSTAFNGALITSIIFVFFLVIMTLADLRAWLYETSNQLDKAERLLCKIEDNSYNTAISTYFDKKKVVARGGGDKEQSLLGKIFRKAAPILPAISGSDDLMYLAYMKLHNGATSAAGSTHSSMSDPPASDKGYAEARVGPKHEHPSIASALNEFRGKPSAYELTTNSNGTTLGAGQQQQMMDV